MKKHIDGYGNLSRALVVMLLVVLVTLATTLSSCRHGKSSAVAQDPHYVLLDSVLSTMNDVDSLAAMTQRYHACGDLVGEMLSLKREGQELCILSRHDEAINAFNKCLEIANERADTIEMINAINGLGMVYRRMDNLSLAYGYLYQALKLSDRYSDSENEMALKARVSVLNNITNIEIESCDYQDADSVVRLSMAVVERLGDKRNIARNYGYMGMIKHGLGNRDSAWLCFRKSMEYNELADNKVGVAICHLHYGAMHEDERRFSHAIEEYEIAYESLKQLNDSWHWVEAGISLARIYILLGEDAQAYHYLKEAEGEAERMGSKEYLSDASMLHYELSLLQGKKDEALEHYVRATKLLDSIHGKAQASAMRSQRIDYERISNTDKVDNLNRDIDKLKRSNNMRMLLSFMLFLMAAAVIGALAYAIRVRMRTNRLMQQVEETRSLFFTNVVHQLRTPLTAIMGTIDNMLVCGGKATTDYNEEQRQDAMVIERQGKNLLTLVDRILEVGGVRSAIREPEWRRGDAVTFIRMVVERYQDKCAERHIEIAYAPQEASIDIVTVPRYLSTIVGNLLENAISYCSDYGKIRVTTSVKDRMLRIRVADDGIGISQKDLPHVFEPFYRGAAAEQLVDGIGIGLTVVRDMAMAMDGTVDVESVKNQGTVFTVELPCKRDNVKERFDALSASLRELPLRKNLHDEPVSRIDNTDKPVALVVEDQNDVARLVGMVLSEMCQVHYATDGEQGLAKAWDVHPDVIVTDVKMPLMDGLEMCRILRKNEQLCHIPVIMVSARTSDADRIRGIEAGADAYLLKPFVRDELLAWVKRFLSSRRLSQPSVEENSGRVQEGRPVTESVDDQAANEAFLAAFALELDKEFGSGNKLVLDHIARKLKMGETQLRHKIQEITGKNVPAYVTQLRMEKAMRLLIECPDCLIGDIAEQCGFQDVAYFSRVFRQYYGMTPTQARNQ